MQNDKRLRRYYDQNLSENNKLIYIGVLCIFLGIAILCTTLYAIFQLDLKGRDTKIIIAALGAVGTLLTNYIGAIYLKIQKVLPNEYLTAPKPSHTFVYVSTIQRMARNLFGAEASFPQDANDLDRAKAKRIIIELRLLNLLYASPIWRASRLLDWIRRRWTK